MNLGKIVVAKEKGEHGLVVFDLLGKGIREVSEAAVTHAEREIAAFNEASGDVLLVRRSTHYGLAGSHALRGRVTRLSLRAFAVDFD